MTIFVGDQGIMSVLGSDFFSKCDLFSFKHYSKCIFTCNLEAKLECQYQGWEKKKKLKYC